MRAFPAFGVRLFVVQALTFGGQFMGGAARMAAAQEAGPPSGEERTPPYGEFDRTEVERIFREYERLTRGLEPKRVQPVPISPWTDGSAARRRGDFWSRDELRQLFGR
jgi:hypothetical protein